MTHVPKEIIQEIADQLECGFRVFLHRETLALITYPNEEKSINFEPAIWKNEIQAVRKEKNNYLEIHSMEPQDAFQVMEDFIATLDNHSFQEKLSIAIQQKRPFAHFKDQINRSGSYRERWFEFRNQRMVEWVEQQLA